MQHHSRNPFEAEEVDRVRTRMLGAFHLSVNLPRCEICVSRCGQTARLQQLELMSVVALSDEVPEKGLRRGQVGTVVEALAPGVYEIEFSDNDGRTYAFASVPEHQLIRLYQSAQRRRGIASFSKTRLRSLHRKGVSTRDGISASALPSFYSCANLLSSSPVFWPGADHDRCSCARNAFPSFLGTDVRIRAGHSEFARELPE